MATTENPPVDQNPFEHLTSRKTLIKSFIINGINKVIPLLLGLLTIPFFMETLGKEKFGILTIIWAFIGYGLLMDFGLGKALTRHVATALGSNNVKDLPEVIISTSGLGFILGGVGCILLLTFAPNIVDFLSITPDVAVDAISSLQIMAFNFPFLVSNMILIGVLEAYQQHGKINTISWPIYIFNFLVPLFALQYFNSLSTVIFSTLIGRIISFFISYFMVKGLFTKFWEGFKPNLNPVLPLLSYGKWIFVNSLVMTLFLNIDTVLISNVMGAALVAYYSTPSFGLSRVSLFVVSSMKVLFPAFSMQNVSNSDKQRRLYNKSLSVLSLVLLAPYALLALLGQFLMSIWLGDAFAAKATPIFLVLCLAFYLMNMVSLTNTYLESTGRAKPNSIISAVLLVGYIAAAFPMIETFGLIGAGYALAAARLLELIAKVLIIEFDHKRYPNKGVIPSES